MNPISLKGDQEGLSLLLFGKLWIRIIDGIAGGHNVIFSHEKATIPESHENAK